MEVELTDHLGYEPHQEPPGGAGNTRNGSMPKTLMTEHGEVRIEKGRPSKYTPEFRREALELVRSSGRSRVEVARSLGVSDGTLGNRVRAEREAAERAADPAALSESEREELRRLRREVAELQIDREILRKAAAFFARETIR